MNNPIRSTVKNPESVIGFGELNLPARLGLFGLSEGTDEPNPPSWVSVYPPVEAELELKLVMKSCSCESKELKMHTQLSIENTFNLLLLT